MRHGHWWLAGLCGLLASLTRPIGLLLLLPFCYEYLRQRQFDLKKIRLDVLSGILIPVGIGLFSLYCAFRFHDPLAFSHAQAYWNRTLAIPGLGIIQSITAINTSGGLLSFQALRNLTDLVPDLLFLILIILSFVGPWRFSRKLRAYSIYAVSLYLFVQLFPKGGTGLFPLESISRYILEIFPGFIVLAGIGKSSKTFDLSYLMVSGAVLFFSLTQFLTGHWML
jgi:Gpi18-like mannosyltransferase